MSRREEFVGVRVIDHVTSEGPCYDQWLTDEPIVRCRDCKFFDTRKCKSQWSFRLDGFCAWGEPREADDGKA